LPSLEEVMRKLKVLSHDKQPPGVEYATVRCLSAYNLIFVSVNLPQNDTTKNLEFTHFVPVCTSNMLEAINTLKMEAELSCKTLLPIYRTAGCHIWKARDMKNPYIYQCIMF
jgi:hypothetical protein